MTGVARSLFRGRDAFSSASAFADAVVSPFEDMWCLGEEAHRFGSGAFNAWAAHLSLLGCVTFHLTQIVTVDLNFLKRLLIPTVNLVSEPLAVDSY